MQPNPKIRFTRRTYNKLVANEMMEDFALRFTAKRARKWSSVWIANTALGIVSFLVLEAIGGAITLNYGFVNAAWAIAAVTAVVFFSGWPISYYAAKYGVDIDLLSRGAGFGYIGSTIASLIYASFTFIFFALEAAIMAMALQLLFELPLAIGYVISALVVIPLVTHGITNISRFQVWTQPIWVLLQIVPLIYVFNHPDSQLNEWISFTGSAGENGQSFNYLLFGAASAVLLALVAQIGEQADFLRFLPEKPKGKRWQWWLAMTMAGPGWMIFGAAKLFLGSFLAWLALKQGINADVAADPAHMYHVAFGYVFDNPQISIILAASFVVISQLKINVANAYAGSLAWSNFFSRVTHNHPGRVVWMFFNVAIALLLMELGIYQTIENMLQVYSVFVLAWLSSVVADLIINKPLGISPKHIEFKRSHLYDINPVGVGSMLIASVIGFTAHFGWYGEMIEAFASYLAFFLPFITVPLIGVLTKGKYYLVKKQHIKVKDNTVCHICENPFEAEDMTFCPAYGKAICSLCCSLDVRCGDQCREQATLFAQAQHFFSRFLTTKLLKKMSSPLSQFIGLTLVLSLISAGILFLIYMQIPSTDAQLKAVFGVTLFKIFFLLLIIIGIVSWLFILARSSNRLALKELRLQTKTLANEIDAHESTALALQKAKEAAESANQAKSRYLTGLSHELRTPLNVLLGYAQLLNQDKAIPDKQKESIAILKRNGEHLADLIEGLLEISKIEAGRMHLQRDEIRIKPFLNQLADMFKMQAKNKGIDFHYHPCEFLPDVVATDKQRFRQILINLLSNAIKFTQKGSVSFSVKYRNQVAQFIVEDTGVGISAEDQKHIFKPFERVKDAQIQAISGTGLGLTISKSLAELMGGEISLSSKLGQGSCFKLSLMLARVNNSTAEPEYSQAQAVAYNGDEKTILVVDDDPNQRKLMDDFLSPLGFNLHLADKPSSALNILAEYKIDLVLMDVTMPEMNGWQLAKKLRENKYIMPIIMVSANARDTEKDQQNAGFHDDYMAKPINMDNLLEKIGQQLNLEWMFQDTENQPVMNEPQTQAADNKPKAGKAQYQALIALAEIGYLSGFKDKLAEISQNYQFSQANLSQLNELVQTCNFTRITEYLRELIDEQQNQ
ncbi:ATP-binding protein [Catenovulum sp. 2E275]|uniref:hybrid sensor histidine kinase/response regulator n=1 Tax=Catenovulum sp. 2E275 TaxID=2980497 RepID=UPI0021CE6527|nr:ATP-binding protein [Catenovulum sp. 2E275]MCU4676925.1 ATP-binding protein [Catenovulum sp. 2E275]